jgi:large subunit ribosomal protein L10
VANRINTTMVAEYKRKLGEKPDFVAVDTVGLSVLQFTELRKLAREKGVQILVVKTTLACIALKDAVQGDGLAKVVAGPTALVYGGEGLPVVARLVADYAKKSGKLAVRGGLFESKVLSPSDVQKFKDVPDRRTLLAQTLATITAPLGNVLGLVQNLLSSPAALSDALARKQEKTAA